MVAMSKTSSHMLGYAMILLASVLFATYGVWSKLMGEGDFGVYYQGWVRALIILILLTPLLLYTKKLKVPARKDWKWMALFLSFTVFTQVPLYYGFIKTGVGAATLMFYAMYLITSYVVGRFVIGERITVVKAASLVLAFVGMSFVFSGESLIFSVVGLLLAGFNGIASGGEVASTKKLTGTYESISIIYYSWVVILLTHLPLSLLFGEVQHMPSFSTEWLAMLAYTAVGLISFWLVVEAYKHVDASVGGLMGLAEIVWAILFGIVLFQEQLTLLTVVGAVLILCAGLLPDTIDLWKRKKGVE